MRVSFGHMLNTFFRALLVYIFVVIGMRIMGKRQVGELQPFELVITLMIAEVASVPMQSGGIPLINGLVPIFALFLPVLLAYITLKSGRARIIIWYAQYSDQMVKSYKRTSRLRFNVNDLLEQLRTNNIVNVSDVEYAILKPTDS